MLLAARTIELYALVGCNEEISQLPVFISSLTREWPLTQALFGCCVPHLNCKFGTKSLQLLDSWMRLFSIPPSIPCHQIEIKKQKTQLDRVIFNVFQMGLPVSPPNLVSLLLNMTSLPLSHEHNKGLCWRTATFPMYAHVDWSGQNQRPPMNWALLPEYPKHINAVRLSDLVGEPVIFIKMFNFAFYLVSQLFLFSFNYKTMYKAMLYLFI